MTRMKKYVAAASVAAALVGVSTVAYAFAPANVSVANAHVAAAKAKASKPTSAVRVVASGERVQAAPKVQLWLTKDGKHWSTPTQANQFRSVVDGNLDMSESGVSLQAEPVDGRYFLSGIYHGKGDAATVTVVTDRGTVTGTVVNLAGQSGWGAWYATSELPNSANSVTVSDAAGHTIATLPLH
ncbi:hypothetical protein [Streptomyces sp. NBC_01643]|uniref:hypothetical protein n=1 Tax=Streptomyces sp. NBC_01643 TaxID=2975906 RepID=UPI002F90FDF3|nr:hypothetical protein OHB03_48315 [Streptomyces sp. NBC_01643]